MKIKRIKLKDLFSFYGIQELNLSNRNIILAEQWHFRKNISFKHVLTLALGETKNKD